MNQDLISRQAAIEVIEAGRLTKLIEAEVAINGLRALPSAQPVAKDINVPVKDCISRQATLDALAEWHDDAITNRLNNLSSVDAVEVVRCKDCKHKPTGSNRDDLEFPDDKCPCQCEDYWYSWKPADEWYCGNGEREKPPLNCGTERKEK